MPLLSPAKLDVVALKLLQGFVAAAVELSDIGNPTASGLAPCNLVTRAMNPHSLTCLLQRPAGDSAFFFAASVMAARAPWVAPIGAVVSRSHPTFIASYRPLKLISPPVIRLHSTAGLGFGCYVHRSNRNTEDRSERRRRPDHVPKSHMHS
jgi:hypothetical protein